MAATLLDAKGTEVSFVSDGARMLLGLPKKHMRREYGAFRWELDANKKILKLTFAESADSNDVDVVFVRPGRRELELLAAVGEVAVFWT